MSNTFTCTSDSPYDRHTYEIVLKTGESVFFNHWEEAQVYWFNYCQVPDYLDVILVKDKEKPKSKGFGR